MKLHIKNGRVIDPANGIDARQDLFIADGRMLGADMPADFGADDTIDAAGMPSVVEFNARLGDPETQPILMRLDSDLLSLLEAAVDGDRDRGLAGVERDGTGCRVGLLHEAQLAEDDLVAVPVAEAHDLVLDGGAVARSRALDRAGE